MNKPKYIAASRKLQGDDRTVMVSKNERFNFFEGMCDMAKFESSMRQVQRNMVKHITKQSKHGDIMQKCFLRMLHFCPHGKILLIKLFTGFLLWKHGARRSLRKQHRWSFFFVFFFGVNILGISCLERPFIQ